VYTLSCCLLWHGLVGYTFVYMCKHRGIHAYTFVHVQNSVMSHVSYHMGLLGIHGVHVYIFVYIEGSMHMHMYMCKSVIHSYHKHTGSTSHKSWVMSHTYMSHVAQMNESCRICKYVMSRRGRVPFTQSFMSHKYEWVMPHIQMSLVAYRIDSCRICKSCRPCEVVTSHTRVSHVTCMNTRRSGATY